jgi:DNA-binding NtrC family response regulator
MRHGYPFIAESCRAIPDSLFETELFGQAKTTDMITNTTRSGLLELTESGTLFLNDVENLSLENQKKLFQAIEKGRFSPVGCDTELPIKARIITATSCPLKKLINSGTFQSDLFYRLNAVHIDAPPLSERKADIPLLAKFFLMKHAEMNDRIPKILSDEALATLKNYPWPGNIRELENEMARLAVFGNPVILDRDLKIENLPALSIPDVKDMRYQDAKILFERQYFTEILNTTQGNMSKASRIANLSRQQLYKKLKQLDLGLNMIHQLRSDRQR